ncbi:EAL domain-containing protein [Shewanella eurypsychrophilus]|uniref:EAL domain-containing protein n=1 Tax=Shewanella eurypsychrophilus TaxID=2593656 RepID=A0ABX8S2P9_9GAMM|nr:MULTISPECIES: EAL domain-containing protein [Shewanella]QFU23906.1 EAL domain-containing protein [Shewanella sp. YLB-09]QXP44888.1 EAL domain-containing protein [Shewanella eurypsychrophilus]
MDSDVIYSLVQNAALLLAMVFVYDAVPRKKQSEYFLLWRLSVGAIIGGITVTTMLTPWEYQSGIFFDTRSVILGISGLFFGGLPTFIAIAIASAYRIMEGGSAVWAGVAVIISSGLFGSIWRAKRKPVIAELKYKELYLFGFILHLLTLSLMFILPMDIAIAILMQLSLPVLLIFPLATAFLGLLLSRRLEIERDAKIQLQDDFMFRSQFNIGNIGIGISSVDQHWLKVNPRVCQMLKYSEAELLAKTWVEMTHYDDLQADLSQFKRMLSGEIDEYEMDKRFVAKDGSIVYTHLTVACQRVNDKVQLVISGLLDITSQKQAESAMRSSQEQLALVLTSSDLGLWDWDIKTNKVDRNERCADLLGCSVDELKHNERLWINGIHPQDRVAVLHSIDVHLKGESLQHSIEYRLVSNSGEIRWILDSGKVVSRDSHGTPLRMCGIHTDITDRKRVEESLKLAASVYNNSSEAMSVQDSKGSIITTNSAFTEITGYCESEVINQHIDMLKCERTNKTQFKQMIMQIAETGKWQGEIWLKHKNATEFIVWLTINTIYDRSGEVYRRVALFSDITEKKQAEHIIWKQANYDPLTGLPNRRMLLEYLGTELLKSDRNHQHFALMFLDLDYFKEINDTLGHDVGDLLLVEAAKRLKACIRESDVVARLGGDEFTIVLSAIEDNKGVERVAQNILLRLAEPYNLGNDTAYITASIGITLYPDDASTIENLLKHADQAMYAAKDQGRNRFHYFTPSMQEEARYRMVLIRDLRKAVKQQEFEVYYQPIIDLTNEQVYKAEALIRWHHPERGLVSPAEFIPIAEDTGLIIDIGNWVFEQAAMQSAAWREKFGVEIQISINKSPIQFRDEGDSFENWIIKLQELNLASNGICVEITEGLLLDASMGVSEKLLAYRDAGIQVSLDDFGTGYSSLAYLKKFDIDYLKIDQSFTRNLESDPNDATLCEAIIVMAHKLGMKVIAEGVETKEQQQILSAAGCNYGQGYLFSKPVPYAEFEAKYLKTSEQRQHDKATS